jgi:UDP-N-acetylglucosamine 2-epimerase (non-hydrolysing)
VLTDSGGVQEEAPSLGVPVLVMRRKTERPENIDGGFAELVGTDTKTITAKVLTYLGATVRQGLRTRPNPYGDGKAAMRIADVLSQTP